MRGGSRRLGWRGVAVELEGPEDLLEALAGHLPAFFAPAPPDATVVGRGVLLAQGAELEVELPEDLGVRGPVGPETLRAAASRVELLVAGGLADRVVLHAGVVAFREQALVLPGRSMAGKSTLVQALLALGATYLSDEFALLTEDGLVQAYPRRMTLRGSTGSRREAPASAQSVLADPLPVAVVALLRHAPGGWSAGPAPVAATALGMLDNCVQARTAPERALATISRTALRADVRLAGERGEADDAAARLRELVLSARGGQVSDAADR